MKTIVSTFALSLALCAAAGATAQTKSAMSASKADTVLLSESTDGNYMVRRYMVKNQNDADYSIRYQINMAKLSSVLDGNSKELNDLNAFVENLMKDSLLKVKWVGITGYSSPDGPDKFNETLAKNRAQDFKNYVDKKYKFSSKYNVKVNWVADDWEMCRALVNQWPVPDKQKVLAVIDGKWTSAEKEAALKKMPASWDYMKKNILPPLRRVELTINYGEGSVFEQRTMIRKPAPKPEPKAAEPCCVVVDESISGIIVEMPDPGQDYDKMTRAERKEFDKTQKMAEKEVRIAEKLAKKEAKAAAKIARKAEKEARKMAEAEAKAAKKSYKELEKGMK